MPFADLPGLRVNYRFDGPEGAPVLVLSNSLGTDLRMWAPQVASLAGRFRILRYDTRGHGQTGVTPGPYTIEALGRDAVALLDALGIARAHFCGLSMGGMIGMWLGTHAAGRVDRLVLCNTAAQIGTPQMWAARLAMVRDEGMAAVAAVVAQRWFTPALLAAPTPQVREVCAMLAATSPDGYAACCAAVRDMDQRDSVGAIGAPTLVIAGTHDPVTPPAAGRLLAERIPGARYVELDAAHLSNIEAAERFTAAVAEFLAA